MLANKQNQMENGLKKKMNYIWHFFRKISFISQHPRLENAQESLGRCLNLFKIEHLNNVGVIIKNMKNLQIINMISFWK